MNPLGFVQFGPVIELESAFDAGFGLAFGVRLMSLGLLPHVLAEADDDKLGTAWTVAGTGHFYPQGKGLRGWYIGPRIEVGKTNSERYPSTLFIGATDWGYRWVKPSGFAYSFGMQAGVARESWTDNFSPDTGTDIVPFAMLVFTLGKSFQQQAPSQPGRVVGN